MKAPDLRALLFLFLTSVFSGAIGTKLYGDCVTKCLVVDCYKSAGSGMVWMFEQANALFPIVCLSGYNGPTIDEGFDINLYDNCPNQALQCSTISGNAQVASCPTTDQCTLSGTVREVCCQSE